jgi:PAS domain S-box-containing protein
VLRDARFGRSVAREGASARTLDDRSAIDDNSRERPFGVDLSIGVFDRATRIAKSLFADSQSLITLVQDGVAWRSRDTGEQVSAKDPAAELVMSSGELMWVEDATLDPRFCDVPVVVGPPYLRSYVAAPIRLADGTTPGVLCVVGLAPQTFDAAKAARLQDLADFVADEWARANSAQAHTEAALALSNAESTLSALAETMPISLVMTDRNLNVIAASRVWREDLGIGDGPVIGRPLGSLSPIYEPYEAAFQRALTGEAVAGAQLELKRPDGVKAWMQAGVTAWRDASGEVAGLIITANDVTELKAALDAASRTENRLNMALALSKVHVWEIDYVRRILFKAGAEDTFFETPQTYESLYRDIYVTIDERDRDMVRECWRRHVEEGEPYRPHYRIARADGKEIWVEGTIQFFSDGLGRPLRMVGAIRDVTEEKLAHRKLMQAIEAAEAANRAKSQFLATMSHEIRTPLNGVLGMAQAMAADELSQTQRERLGVIRDSGHSLLTILNDVLDISKIEAGKLDLEEAEFDIDEIAESARHAFAALADDKGLFLNLQVDPAAEGLYRGDATRVRQILYNLISNALKFTDRGGVSVRVGRRGGWVKLTVADTGIGIARQDMKRLFEKFEQADASTTRRYGGSGLGLAICRQLAELMGGRVRARSRLGEGTTFVVSLRLPWVGVALKREASETADVAAEAPVALRVLAAEDNEINQLVLKTLLAQVGLTPTTVGDGQAALEAWEAGDWDVILMDVQMPRMDGPTATREIRRREVELGRPHTPIIALTANAMSHQVAEYRAAGMDGFVAKPIEVGQLFATLQSVLESDPDAEASANAA